MIQQPGPQNVKRRKVYRGLKIFVLVYCVIGIVVYYLQDFIIIQSKKLDKDHQFTFKQPFSEINIAYDGKTNINIVKFLQSAPTAKSVVLYFHGNKSNIEHYSKFAPNFTKNGYEVWMIDYPGYGKSTGTFTEETAYDWSLLLYNMARTRFSPDSIIIYGKSLGTGIASQLASIRDCKCLVLETPYYSMTSIGSYYLWMYPMNQMLHYKFPTNEYLKKVTAPVIIFHGTGDKTIPYNNAIKLKPELKKRDEFITIEGGKHNNLNSYKVMQNKLDSLLR